MLDLMIPMIMTIRLKMIMNKSKEPALAGSFVYVGMKDVKPHIRKYTATTSSQSCCEEEYSIKRKEPHCCDSKGEKVYEKVFLF